MSSFGGYFDVVSSGEAKVCLGRVDVLGTSAVVHLQEAETLLAGIDCLMQ